MTNGLTRPIGDIAFRSFQEGQKLGQESTRRNALLQIAGAVQREDLPAAGQAAAEIGDVGMVLEFKALIKQGKQAELDQLKRSADAIQNTLASAQAARQQNPQNFPAVARAMAQQFLAANPDLDFTPDQVLGAILDPAQGAAALAEVQDIDGALKQAKFEFEQEKAAGVAERGAAALDISRGRLTETQRANLAREDIQRSKTTGATGLTVKEQKALKDENSEIGRAKALITNLDPLIRSGTGPAASLAEIADKFAALIGTRAFPDTVENRNKVRILSQELKKVLVNNPRFPVAEQELVQRLLPDANAIFVNPGAEADKLRSLAQFIDIREQSNTAQLGGEPVEPGGFGQSARQRTATNAQGEKVFFNEQTGQWEPL